MPARLASTVPARGPSDEAVAHLCLTAAIPHSYEDVPSGHSLVTPPATSAADLDYQITILHEELEQIREDARSRFADASQPNRSTNGSGS